MTNVYKHPDKKKTRRRLFEIGIEALETAGWKVERVQGAGKSSLRRIKKEGESKLVSIRTTQDTRIAFPRDKKDERWTTLSEADLVLAVSLDDPDQPSHGQAHLISGEEMRARFDRAYQARKAAGHTIPVGRGVWIPLYQDDAQNPVNRVGAGAGLTNQAIYRAPLEKPRPEVQDEEARSAEAAQTEAARGELTIDEAKRGLAATFGIDPSNVKIVIEA